MTYYILFEEEDVVKELARRGLAATNMDITMGLHKAPAREPLVGWKCLTCGKVMRLNKAPDGQCTTCLSVKLDHIFGDKEYNVQFKRRKEIMKALRKKQTRNK